MKNKVAGEWWELEVADKWDVEVDLECVTIAKPDGCGALQVSAYQKKDRSIVTSEDTLARVPDEMRPHVASQTWGEFDGFQLIYRDGDTFWRKWWLAKSQVFVFVTYNCPIDKSDEETRVINQMVNSLRERKSILPTKQ